MTTDRSEITTPEPIWTEEKVAALNARQANDQVHPYTCPGDFPQCESQRNLIATRHGWVCQCGRYKQGWAHGDSPVPADTIQTKPPLGGPAEVMVFFRQMTFYQVQGVAGVPLATQAAEHAALNPGTLRVEDIDGNVLWRLQ
jgi:hypothetical protein